MTGQMSSEPSVSDRQDKRRFWALFTGGAIAATAGLTLLMYLIDPDGCSDAFAVSGFIMAIVPAGVVIGVIGLAARSSSGHRGWLIFAAVLLPPIWLLWALAWLLAMGFSAASCV